MNIFVLDANPYTAAEAYCNKHLVKMPTELGNMVLWPQFYYGYQAPRTQKNEHRILTHENHPASKWVRETSANYDWALAHLGALCWRYQSLYRRRHDALRLYDFATITRNHLNFSKDYLTPFPRCFGVHTEGLASVQDTVEAYRQYYWVDKREFARWPQDSAVPRWWPGEPEKYLDKNFKNGHYTKR